MRFSCRSTNVSLITRLWLALVLIALNSTSSWGQQQPADQAAKPVSSKKELTYQAWLAACSKLPPNRELDGKFPPPELLQLPTFREFEQVLEAIIALHKTGDLSRDALWVGAPPERDAFYSLKTSYYRDPAFPFQPFVEKLTLAPGSKIVIHGDLHGDVRSLLVTLEQLRAAKILDGFRVVDPTAHLCFLGDYVDRGSYGVETLYTLFRLKLANPQQVHLCRGNHESYGMTSRYGFLAELQAKYGDQVRLTKLMRVFDLLPVVLYVGTITDSAQMNHGGMEPGFDPRPLLAASGPVRYQLLGKLEQKKFHAAHPGWLGDDAETLALAERRFRDFTPQPPSLADIGFSWNDFTVFADEPELGEGRPFVFGKRSTQFLLTAASTDKHHLRAVFRAHQHTGAPNPLMKRLVASKGAFRHWQEKHQQAGENLGADELRSIVETGAEREIPDGSVWTFNVSPDSGYGTGVGFDFVTYGVLTLQREFPAWRIKVLHAAVF